MKLFICKKSLIIASAVIIALGAILGICAGAVAASAHKGEQTVVIDAGHGGIDAGVIGTVTSTKESDINLSISKYLRGYFADAGFNAGRTLRRKHQGFQNARYEKKKGNYREKQRRYGNFSTPEFLPYIFTAGRAGILRQGQRLRKAACRKHTKQH